MAGARSLRGGDEPWRVQAAVCAARGCSRRARGRSTQRRAGGRTQGGCKSGRGCGGGPARRWMGSAAVGAPRCRAGVPGTLRRVVGLLEVLDKGVVRLQARLLRLLAVKVDDVTFDQLSEVFYLLFLFLHLLLHLFLLHLLLHLLLLHHRWLLLNFDHVSVLVFKLFL